MFLEIYCDRKVIEAWILTFAAFGKLMASILLILFPLTKDKKGNLTLQYIFNLITPQRSYQRKVSIIINQVL